MVMTAGANASARVVTLKATCAVTAQTSRVHGAARRAHIAAPSDGMLAQGRHQEEDECESQRAGAVARKEHRRAS
jgi:hypothetical protein